MFFYETFGSTDLPTYNPNYAVPAMASVDVALQTAGGIYDAGGSEQIGVGRTILSHRGVVTGETAAGLITAIRSFRKLRGTRQKLYRRWRDNTLEWVYARCLAVEGTRSSGMVLEQELEFRFLVLSPVWYSNTQTNEQFTLTGSPQNESISNDGDAIVDNVIITITAGSADITSITLATGDAEIQFAGTITAGDEVVIDCGALSVLNDGSDAYDDFALTSNHAEQSWFPLAVGSNSITITYSGGGSGSTVDFDYYDGWH